MENTDDVCSKDKISDGTQSEPHVNSDEMNVNVEELKIFLIKNIIYFIKNI